jgi:hypothetical protein
LERIQTLENAIRGVTPTLLFDIETAYGTQLDQLGAILKLPREGWDDPLYRIFLRTQALLILPDRRTQARLIEVARSLMNTDAGMVDYQEFRPKTYTLGVGAVDLLTFSTWIRFLELCRPATYNAQIIWNPDEAFGYDDATGTVPTPTVFGYSDATFTIVAGGHWSAILSP